MTYAEIAVNSPVAQRRSFSYAVPSHLAVTTGQAVWVPFGPQVLQGIVLELTTYPQVEETREILDVIGDGPVLFDYQVELACWISTYYLAPLFESAALMLAPGFQRKTVSLLIPGPRLSSMEVLELSPEEGQLLELLRRNGNVSLKDAENALGKTKAKLSVARLLREGLVSKSQVLEGKKVGPKEIPELHLAVPSEEAVREADRLSSRAPKQAALLRLLAERPNGIALVDANMEIVGAAAAVKALQHRGLVTVNKTTTFRDPLSHHEFRPSLSPVLNTAQAEAVERIRLALQRSFSDKQASVSSSSKLRERTCGTEVFLLHGITGSGKTEVYLNALAEAVSLGKRGIALVPEIALTPQTIERFASRFPGRVAVLHSKLSLGEQFDQWQLIREGAFDVVIGSRGALFSPQPDLGLIIIDEEQEWTYKQQEQSPRYHARDVAIKLAELTRAVLVLGSATPDVESSYRVSIGRYQLLSLPERIASEGKPSLPEVEIVDMRQELRDGNRSIFSRELRKAVHETLACGEQAILFLNRRGAATFVQCRDCGFVLRCSSCDIPFTYHSVDQTLMCHQCSRRRKVVSRCPGCSSPRIKLLGIGTQKVEEEAANSFPGARLLRWDRDITKGKHSHEAILSEFAAHNADILVGTQMIAKGLDIPSVTVVGIISADTMLHFPDFRASERTFQLLCQVAGRAGRGTLPGKVVIQTYTPEHYAVQTAAGHDYTAIYDQEIAYRRRYEYPPFSRLARLVYVHTNNDMCQREAEKMARRLMIEIESKGIPDLVLVGPSPAFFSKVRGKFRWQIVLRGSNPARFLENITIPRGWTVDIDPVSLL